MTLEGRINEAVNLLQEDGDCILFEDGERCFNEQELRTLLEGRFQ